jgi:NADH-quinone oxidoreductase subunit L
MAGPTPISALIHAATMVAAGVYLLARTHGLLEVAPTVSLWVAIVGTLTALAASVGGVLQNNFKKVIAFSTIAQLGYMFAGVGVGAPFSGLFHLFTHAAFKALLFLAAGIVIHGASNRESLVGLRGLGRYFPYSRVGFLIGSMALIGLPVVTAGAFSKDTILDATLAAQPLIGYALIAGVFLTGLYIGRLYAIIYAAPATDDHAVHHDAHAERWMNWALIPLMAGSIVFGYAGPWLDNALAGVLGGHETLPPLISPVGLLAFGLGAIGFAGAWWFALRKPAPAGADTPPAYAPAGWIAAIEAVSNGASRGVARVQSGALASYALATLLGVALVLVVRVALG